MSRFNIYIYNPQYKKDVANYCLNPLSIRLSRIIFSLHSLFPKHKFHPKTNAAKTATTIWRNSIMAFMHLHHHLPSPSLSFSRSSLPLCRSSSRFSPPSSPFPSQKYTDFGDRLLHLPQKSLSFVLSGALALGITLSGSHSCLLSSR